MGAVPFSSLGKSIAATHPAFAAPVTTQDDYIRGGWAGFAPMPMPHVTAVRDGACTVSRKPRRKTRYLYSYGSQMQSWFRMIATGTVEWSKFQKYWTQLYDASFNDGLYEAGYPQNLGLSVKVPTVSTDLLNGTTGPFMVNNPSRRRVIFTRRAYSTSPAVPAQPQAQ